MARISRGVWAAGLPVSPAVVTWKIRRPGGKVLERAVAADFRHRVPPRRRFWTVFARGTYENAPRFGPTQYTSRPGRYVFELARSFDTRRLRNGRYVLTARAADIRGNAAGVRVRFAIRNRPGRCTGSLPARPGSPLPGEPALLSDGGPASAGAEAASGGAEGSGTGDAREPRKALPVTGSSR